MADAHSFRTTRWTLVLGANRHDPAALAELCRTYRPPLLSHALRRGFGQDAEDVVQGFILTLLEKDGSLAADRTRGRFRSYLLGAFNHYLHSHSRDACAQKRGGGATHQSFDAPEDDPAHAAHPPDCDDTLHFDRAWAQTVLRLAFERLRADYAKRPHLFDALLPALNHHAPYSAPDIAEKLGITARDAHDKVRRFREAYRDCLRESLADTVADDADIDDERCHLLDVVQGAGLTLDTA